MTLPPFSNFQSGAGLRTGPFFCSLRAALHGLHCPGQGMDLMFADPEDQPKRRAPRLRGHDPNASSSAGMPEGRPQPLMTERSRPLLLFDRCRMEPTPTCFAIRSRSERSLWILVPVRGFLPPRPVCCGQRRQLEGTPFTPRQQAQNRSRNVRGDRNSAKGARFHGTIHSATSTTENTFPEERPGPRPEVVESLPNDS